MVTMTGGTPVKDRLADDSNPTLSSTDGFHTVVKLAHYTQARLLELTASDPEAVLCC
jgi:hypothetical protein